MLDLQESMNLRVHDNWRAQHYEWYRAIWVESAELMDHYGWKWWKKQIPDDEQIKLELVDIWHFGLSMLLMNHHSVDAIADELSSCLKNEHVDFRVALEEFASNTLSTKNFAIKKFATLLNAINMSFEELYIAYIGKNVLNFFRQDHGYKDGSYQKLWGGMEDNEHLVQIVNSLDTSNPNFKDNVYTCLSQRYSELCP
ncbi:dUTP diphosphatase [Candidatus Endobugula sertula]|uniref:dUTP diphosphatase n=1 Tax=Candidatus Endobugula sertula TaxID=62101 RepID=A0A1D2QSF9_9GAMM|nr:dUTP diphosphatase [Candidatus Endobugula sertula]